MNAEDVKLVAQVVIKAQDTHEASWTKKSDNNGMECDDYLLDKDDCLKQACDELGLPHGLWYVLSLANYWSNDLRMWADVIVACEDIDASFGVDKDESDDSGNSDSPTPE